MDVSGVSVYRGLTTNNPPAICDNCQFQSIMSPTKSAPAAAVASCVWLFAVKFYHYQQILNLSIHQNQPKIRNRNQIKTSFRTPLLFSNVSFSCFSSPRAPQPRRPTSRCRGPTCRPSAQRSRPPCPLLFPRGFLPPASL